MMGMGANPKKIASIIVSRMSPENEGHEASESHKESESLVLAAKQIMQAFEEKSTEKLASALKQAFECCMKKEEPSEGPEVMPLG
jgi:hypothetical protein